MGNTHSSSRSRAMDRRSLLQHAMTPPSPSRKTKRLFVDDDDDTTEDIEFCAPTLAALCAKSRSALIAAEFARLADVGDYILVNALECHYAQCGAGTLLSGNDDGYTFLVCAISRYIDDSLINQTLFRSMDAKVRKLGYEMQLLDGTNLGFRANDWSKIVRYTVDATVDNDDDDHGISMLKRHVCSVIDYDATTTLQHAGRGREHWVTITLINPASSATHSRYIWQLECVVCMQRMAFVRPTKCMHVCLCIGCAATLRRDAHAQKRRRGADPPSPRCPVCRCEADQFTHVILGSRAIHYRSIVE